MQFFQSFRLPLFFPLRIDEFCQDGHEWSQFVTIRDQIVILFPRYLPLKSHEVFFLWHFVFNKVTQEHFTILLRTTTH